MGTVPAVPFSQEPEEKRVLDISQVRVPYPKPNEVDWEQRRFELMKMLVAQDRRSVVLGKLRASNRQIVQVCRELADAAIKELQTHSMQQSHDKRREERDELVDGRP